MNESSRRVCNENRLHQFLEGELGSLDERDLVLHLEQCPTCRQRLRDSAAEQSWWRDAGDFLKDDEVDLEYTHTLGLDGGCAGTSVGRLGAIAQLVVDSLAPTDDPRMLGRLGHYEVAGVIGFGGMGVVLKGFDAPLDRYVAIKVLSPHLASSGAARKRFAREAKAAAAVMHENVIAIHNVAEAHGLPYLVMPYVSGPSLQRRLEDAGPLETVETLRIGLQVASGLAAAHAQGLVHRDVKPANILLENGVERVLLTDFGLARAADDASLTHSGVIAGTPHYMSPEQSRGEPVDCRSDLFSLGSVLYAMCTGRTPFRAENSYGVLRRISESPPRAMREVASTVPEWMCEIVEKLHAKNPSERFQSAGEVAELLSRWLSHLQQPVTIPAPPRMQQSGLATGRGAIKALHVIVAVVIVGAGVLLPFIWHRSMHDHKPQKSDHSSATVNEPAATVRQLYDEAMLRPLLDDRSLHEGYDQFRTRASRLERQWSQSLPLGGERSLDFSLDDLDRQMDKLAEQIDRDQL